jgi:hypothetical protein
MSSLWEGTIWSEYQIKPIPFLQHRHRSTCLEAQTRHLWSTAILKYKHFLLPTTVLQFSFNFKQITWGAKGVLTLDQNISYPAVCKHFTFLLHTILSGVLILLLCNKVDEFLISLSSNAPQIICVSEHHLRTDELSMTNFSQYTVGTSNCRQLYIFMEEYVLRCIRISNFTLQIFTSLIKRGPLKFVL